MNYTFFRSGIYFLSSILLVGCANIIQKENTPRLSLLLRPLVFNNCIVDQPFGITRYTIVTTGLAGLNAEVIQKCRSAFEGIKHPIPKDNLTNGLSTFETNGLSVRVQNVSCSIVIAEEYPTVFFFVSVIEPRFLQANSIANCMSILEGKYNSVPPIGRLPSLPSLPSPQGLIDI